MYIENVYIFEMMLLVWMILLLLFRPLQGSWIAPGMVYSGIWFLLFSLSLLIAPWISITFSGFSFIFFSAIIALAFSQIGLWYSSQIPLIYTAKYTEIEKIVSKLSSSYIYFVLISFLTTFLSYSFYSSVFSFASVYDLVRQVSNARYLGSFDSPTYISIFAVSYWMSAWLGGIGFAKSMTYRHRLFFLLWLAPIILQIAIDGARSSFVVGASFFLSGLFVGLKLINKEKSIKFQYLFLVPLILIFVYYGLIFSRMYRWNQLGSQSAFEANQKIALVFVFGSLSAFTQWYENGGRVLHSYYFGTQSFMGIPHALGITVRPLGLYTEFTVLSHTINSDGGYFHSNVFTAFRPVIEDFSTFGAFFFTGAFSFVAGISWGTVRHSPRISIPLATLYYCYVIYSPITSMYIYASIVLAILLIIFYTAFTVKL